MFHFFKIAYLNLGRNHRRTILTALAIAITLGLLILIETISEGEGAGALDATIKLQTGHVQIREESYEEEKRSLKWEYLIKDPQTIIAKVETLELVRIATPQLWGNATMVIDDETVNVQIIGIDPPNKFYDAIRDAMVNGAYIQPDDREGILMGQKLAKDLGLKVGDEVNLTISTSDGIPDTSNFTIRGLFNTGASNYDEVTVFMPLVKAQSVVRAEDRVSAIIIMLDDREHADIVVNALSTSDYKVLEWREMNKLTLQAQALSDAFMIYVNIIVMAMGVTIVINTLVMAVFERTREIGVLLSIGMKAYQIMVIFLIEASLLGLIGMVIGNIFGILFSWYFVTKGLYIGDVGVTGGMIYTDILYARFNIPDIINLSILSFVITLIGALYPAVLAARMEPIQALHSD